MVAAERIKTGNSQMLFYPRQSYRSQKYEERHACWYGKITADRQERIHVYTQTTLKWFFFYFIVIIIIWQISQLIALRLFKSYLYQVLEKKVHNGRLLFNTHFIE